jgi:hypothetical protein
MKASETVEKYLEEEREHHEKVVKKLEDILKIIREVEKKVPDVEVSIKHTSKSATFYSEEVVVDKMSFWEEEYEGNELVKARFWKDIDGVKVFRMGTNYDSVFIIDAQYFHRKRDWKIMLKKRNIPVDMIERVEENVRKFRDRLSSSVDYDSD